MPNRHNYRRTGRRSSFDLNSLWTCEAMKPFNRRGFLRGAVTAPLAAPFIEAQALELSKVKVGLVRNSTIGIDDMDDDSTPVEIFHTWESFWEKIGKQQAKEESYYINKLDPDIAMMHSLPLNSKFLMQRRRNFEYEKESIRKRFFKKFSVEGFFKG